MMPELKPAPCSNDSIVEACKPWVDAIDGTNSKGLVGPCKFCGHSAWLQPYNEGRNYQAPDSHPTGVFAQCANSKCRATMHRMQCWVDDAHTALEEPQLLVDALLARWNTRPDGGDSLRLKRCIDMAMGCLDATSTNPDERLVWLRLLDAAEGREPRSAL